MSSNSVLRSEATAWLAGAVLLVGFSAYVYSLIGWIGVGVIGLLGLVISTTVALHGGHAVTGSGYGSGDAHMYAKQLEEARKSQSSPEQKMAAAAGRAKRSRTLYLINTVFIGMMTLGFGLFTLYEL